ncbi:Ubinuclein conserved middle domain-containing protein [Gongronella butleri]|nr:Ubinuclein conserved middle domain-containing protein [Gongronella butleri]
MPSSVRIRLDVDADQPIMFSYPELVKKQEQTLAEPVPMDLDPTADAYYKSLLDSAAKYDLGAPGEDLDTDAEEDAKERKGDDYYDFDDPFIDDSEMMLDHDYEYIVPEFDGFFVYHGSLIDDSEPIPEPVKKKTSTSSKPKGGSSSSGSAAHASSSASGAAKSKSSSASSSTPRSKLKDEPTSDTKAKKPTMKKSSSTSTQQAASTSDDSAAGTKKGAKNASDASSASSSKKRADPTPSTSSSTATSTAAAAASAKKTLDDSLLPYFDKLRELRKLESFEVKSRFPQSLRPAVQDIGLIMFRLYRCVDETVLKTLMSILPYNRFTLRKYLVTKVGPLAIPEAQKEIESMLGTLTQHVNESMPSQIETYEQRLQDQKNEPSSKNANEEGEGESKVDKRFKWTDKVRKTLHQIFALDQFWTQLQLEIAELSQKASEGISEAKERKLLYTKLMTCWPEGWMTTYDLSRQYSGYKTKMKNVEMAAAAAAAAAAGNAGTSAVPGNATATGTKRPVTTGLKRTASASSITSTSKSAAGKYLSNSTSPAGEKKKKMTHDAPSPSPITTAYETETPVGQTTSAANTNGNASLSQQDGSIKPASMNIASLISSS